MFTREEIIVRSKFICKFFLKVRKAKVSSFQGLNEVNLFLVTTFLLDYTDRQTHDSTEFQIMSDGQKFNFFAKKCPIVVRVVFTGSFSQYSINTETNYWKILHIKINHLNYINAEKRWANFIKVNMLLCRIDTYSSGQAHACNTCASGTGVFL